MTGVDFTHTFHRPSSQGGAPPPPTNIRGVLGDFFRGRNIVAFILALLFIYGAYFWFIRRVVVHQGQVLVLLKKNGARSLSGDQVIIPRPPTDPSARAQWEKTYGDCNGILEQVYLEGT